MASSTTPLSADSLKPLYDYTACDISDALLKLKVPGAGFLADLQPLCTSATSRVQIAPASTVLFAPKSGDDSSYGEKNIPAGKHWADLTEPHTFVVLSQPAGQKNAVLGGIMAMRMKKLEAQGIAVVGRARDMDELKATGLTIWARGTSTVGAGGESKPHSLNVPITVDLTTVNPGDLIFCDPGNGVVVIPRGLVSAVIELLPKITQADDKVKEDVEQGVTVHEAFKRHRSNL